MDSDVPLRLAEDVTYQSLGEGEDTVILSLGSGELYTCNETTTAFLAEVDGSRTLAQIIAVLAEQYEAPEEQLRADFSALADELADEGIIVAGGD
jgi:pyrroloquinoline quinone biosynthesis protein D